MRCKLCVYSVVGIIFACVAVWYFGYHRPKQQKMREYQEIVISGYNAVFSSETDVRNQCANVLIGAMDSPLTDEDKIKIKVVCNCVVSYTYEAIGNIIENNMNSSGKELANSLVNIKNNKNVAINMAIESCIIDIMLAGKARK